MARLPAALPDVVSTLTVRTILDRALAACPEGEALVGRSGRMTYRELDVATNRAANALLALGLGAGDTIAVSLRNDIPVAITLLAAGRIGAVWVGINPHLAGPEKAFIVADCGAVALVADATTISSLDDADLGGESVSELRHRIRSDDDPAWDQWGTMVAGASADRPDAIVEPLQVAAIGYTSGTTGFPKGVVHCHRALVLQGAVFTSTRSMSSESRYGIWMPLCNIQSLMLSLLTMAQVGGTTVVVDRSDAVGIAEWFDRERVTHSPSVAVILHDLTSNAAVTPAMLSSLEEITAGGADVPYSLIERFHDLTGVFPSVGYGQTESAGAISMTPAGEMPVPSAVGKPLPHLEIALMNDGGGAASGEIGELCVRAAREGPWAGLFVPMLGYWRRPEETAEVIRDGWLCTGDLASLDDDGNLFIRGRKMQMILRGGANVYPAEVERVLLEEPGVDAAAVLGIPDARLGERVVAIVSARSAHGSLAERCRDRCRDQLARYKCPDTVVVTDHLPRNATGKVIRADAIRLFHDLAGTATA